MKLFRKKKKKQNNLETKNKLIDKLLKENIGRITFFDKILGRNHIYKNAYVAIIIVFCLAIAIQTYLYVNKYNEAENIQLYNIYQQDVERLANREIPKQYNYVYEKDKLNQAIKDKYKNLKLFNFDPNDCTFEEFIKLGLTEKQANEIINYRNKGFRFVTKDDFKKVYKMRMQQYIELKPYINLPEKEPNYAEKTKLEIKYFDFDPNFVSKEEMLKLGFSSKQIEIFIDQRINGKNYYCKEDFLMEFFVKEEIKSKISPFVKINLNKLFDNQPYADINKATKEQFCEIGFSREEAEEIIKFRENCGGFFYNWQITHIQTISYNKAKNLTKNLYVCNSYKPQKLKINQLEESQLAQNPYINDKQAKQIANYTAKNKIKDIEELEKLEIFDNKQIKKIKKYLSFE